ncbi:MAG: penicillin-binding protein, partial [Clostridia bacterium]|nr:penicillin-binding protein [Clostridia bacterium]
RESEIAYLRSEDFLNVGDTATAAECMEKLIRRYGAEDIEDPADVRRVVSVRYNLERNYFSRTNPCTIAEDVSIEAVTILSERADSMPGVEIRVTQEREYTDGTLAPHVLGTVGMISAEQYAAEKETGNTYSAENVSGYAYTDTYGQNGIENAYEAVLRGTNGKETIETDSTGVVLSTAVTEEPEAGDTVWLTLDADLQRAANEALAEQIGSGLTEDCTAGAAVALDVNTGGILACASYPNYDLTQYTQSTEYLLALYDDETQPLFNRALNGLFTPGSVFKPLVAIAALEEGVINADATPVLCDGAYHYYAPDYEPECLGSHGEVDLLGALSRSCNSYFFDVGRMLQITPMRAYAEAFSLGEKTGCELAESVGIMSSPEEYETRHAGADWFEGLTIQSAIGQCDNMFTPIELATYCSVIANGGTRYKTHFLEKVTDYDRETVITETEPEVVLETGVSAETFKTVQEGMRLVCTEGTAASTFADFGIAVAGKTGTAETYEHSDNLTFIGYAPYEDPEIAVAVVIEYGGGGNAAKEVAKAIFEAYFFGDAETENNDEINSDKTEEQADTALADTQA